MDRTANPRSETNPAAHSLFSLVLEQVQDYAQLLLDTEGQIIGWYAGAENIFGYRAEEIVGQMASQLFTPEDIERGMDLHELHIARERGKTEVDRWHVRKDGTRIWVTGMVDALRNQDGEIVGFSKIVRDRTELKSQIETLESRISALTDANQRKNIFIGTMAHELGNTFASLRMTLDQALANQPESQDVVALLTNLQRQVESAEPLVNDLKDITRIEEGQIRLEKKRIILNDVLEQACAACRPFAEERRQHFELLLPPAFVVVNGDPKRLHEVFLNLIQNASKYTPEEGHIWVKMMTEGREVVVKVEDTGVGIGPETLPRLFQLFTTETSSQEQSQGGMGIGLWLVKNLVSLHGGTVSAKSEGKNRGSQFNVRLYFEQIVPVDEEIQRETTPV